MEHKAIILQSNERHGHFNSVSTLVMETCTQNLGCYQDCLVRLMTYLIFITLPGIKEMILFGRKRASSVIENVEFHVFCEHVRLSNGSCLLNEPSDRNETVLEKFQLP